MSTLRPTRIGDVPLGLSPHHREFLRSLKDAIEILIGAVAKQGDISDNPSSQAVIFGDLVPSDPGSDSSIVFVEGVEEQAMMWALILGDDVGMVA
jgi:hypothetical protein